MNNEAALYDVKCFKFLVLYLAYITVKAQYGFSYEMLTFLGACHSFSLDTPALSLQQNH